MSSSTDSGIDSTHLLAGGGGDYVGFAQAGIRPRTAVNHLQAAIDTIRLNDPDVHGVVEDIGRVNMRNLPRTTVCAGSPICREGSPAGRRSTAGQAEAAWEATRATAWCLLRYAEVHQPEIVVGENVLDFATRWTLFPAWLYAFELLGYTPQVVPFNAAHVSSPGNPAAPQNRERLLFCFARRGIKVDLEIRPPAICPECGPVTGVRMWMPSARRFGGHLIGRYGTYRYICPNRSCGRRAEPVTEPLLPGINWDLPMSYVRNGRPNNGIPYAPNTRARIQAGLAATQGEPFMVICRRNKTYELLDGPTATITAAGNHHMLVQPGPDMTVDGCRVRMLSTAEKAFAQRFPASWRFVVRLPQADRDKNVRGIGGLLTGNAVPVNVARWTAERIRYALAA